MWRGMWLHDEYNSSSHEEQLQGKVWNLEFSYGNSLRWPRKKQIDPFCAYSQVLGDAYQESNSNLRPIQNCWWIVLPNNVHRSHKVLWCKNNIVQKAIQLGYQVTNQKFGTLRKSHVTIWNNGAGSTVLMSWYYYGAFDFNEPTWPMTCKALTWQVMPVQPHASIPATTVVLAENTL